MPNQKGSLKDRLKSWFLFLMYKKEQRKKLKEMKKKKKLEAKQKQVLATGKYYSKKKVVGLTFLGLFLGIFEPKIKDKKINVEVEIKTLEEKLKNDELVMDDIKKIKILDQMLNENEKNKILSSKKLNSNYVKRLEIIKENVKKEEVQKIIKENTLKQEQSIISKKKDQSLIDNKEDVNDKSYVKTNKTKNKAFMFYTPILEVKELNKNLDKYTKKIKDLSNKVKQEQSYNNLFDYEFEIKQLKLKIEEILLKYEALKELPGFKNLDNYIKIKDIDLYEIRKNDKKIKEKIGLCNETLVQIEEQKKQIITTKQEPSKEIHVEQTTKNDVKEENKKDIKKEESDNKLIEITLANKIVYDNLIKEQKRVAKLERMLSKISIKKRKPTIFYYTKNMVSSILNLTFSLFPLKLFKNKILGGLVSGIMINNSLRSVKRVLNPDIEIKYIYYDLEKEISSTSNYLNCMDYLLNDSLDKINDIKKEILNKYGNDINYQSSLNSYLDELNKIQNKIEFEREKVLGLHQDLDRVYKKNKQKVLTIERYNSQ